MAKIDARVDAYIAKAAPFAQPILHHLREVVHNAWPEVEETIKWGAPHFEYHGIVCMMASFKQHCAFGFRNASQMSDPHRLFPEASEAAMGQLGQIRSLEDLPSDQILAEYIKEAAELNKAGVKPKQNPVAAGELQIPDYFLEALRQDGAALKTFETLSPAKKRDYIEWVTEAKTEDTRNKRLATSVEWMAEGKERNWKYTKK